MSAYYNEIDPFAADWLRNLIGAGLIADGVVDERSISDVRPEELFEFTQCHFFAGIGVWSHALRGAGWDDDRPVWTGSCPCQPFSGAGKRKGIADKRHLFPDWFHLIRECRPATIFGEQVASKDGLGWIDLVQADMEGEGYAFAPFDLCASGFGAPHIRQRLWFVAHSDYAGSQGRISGWPHSERQDQHGHIGCDGSTNGGLADTHSLRAQREPRDFEEAATVSEDQRQSEDGSDVSQRGGEDQHGRRVIASHGLHGPNIGASKTNGFWGDVDWLFCRDGKWRPVEPNTFPLAYGIAGRVGRCRAYGNAIVSEVAQGLISSFIEGERE